MIGSLQRIQGGSGSPCPAPIVPESLAARSTAFAYPAESVPEILSQRFSPRRVACKANASAASPPRPDSWDPASKPLPLTAGLRLIPVKGFPLSSDRLQYCPFSLPSVRMATSTAPLISSRAYHRDSHHTPRCRIDKSKVLISGLPANHCCCSAIAAESAPRKARA